MMPPSPGQGPIDPRGAFVPPPPPEGMPPGMMPPFPPPMMYPPPAPRHGFTRAIFVTLATTIFGFSLLINLYMLAFGGITSGGAARSNTVVTGDPKEKVAVVPVSGIIMEEQAEKFDRFMEMAEKDLNVKALVLEIDTPGGSVTASDVMYHRVEQFKKNRQGVPVVVTMGSLATSGGYYVACAADHIYAQRTTMTGNIGVLLPRFNISKLAERWGVEETTITSTGATFKNAGSMFKPEKMEDTKYLQGIADEAFGLFKGVVKEGRGERLKKSVDVIADGKVYVAKEALELGLIDQIGYAEDAYEYAAQTAGLKNKTVVKYQDQPSLLQLLSSQSNMSRSVKGGVTVNGVNVNLDMESMERMLRPRLLYVWCGE